MKVKTLKAHPYAGKRRKVGAVYDCLPRFAKVLKVIGKVEYYQPPKKQVAEKSEVIEQKQGTDGDKATEQIKPATDQESAKTEAKKEDDEKTTPQAEPAKRGRGRPRKNTYKTTEMKAE